MWLSQSQDEVGVNQGEEVQQRKISSSHVERKMLNVIAVTNLDTCQELQKHLEEKKNEKKPSESITIAKDKSTSEVDANLLLVKAVIFYYNEWSLDFGCSYHVPEGSHFVHIMPKVTSVPNLFPLRHPLMGTN